MPENVVKDALKEKTEHALSPKQVSGDEGVDYEVIQKRGSYDGNTLVRMQQIYEGKEVYGHQLTAHVDKKGIIRFKAYINSACWSDNSRRRFIRSIGKSISYR